MPATPAEPATHIAPAAPAEPATPAAPAEPARHITSAAPVAPAAPEAPVAPATPAEPATPVAPAEPARHVTPAAPAEPAGHIPPAAPIAPAAVAAPLAPASPLSPAEPATHIAPAAPAPPAAPSVPTTDAAPASPTTPHQSPPLLVVAGVRADFYGACLEHPGLVAALRDCQLPLGPMTRDELCAAIEGPARRTGLVLDSGLAELFLAELGVHGDAPAPPDAGTLPLLAHALLATWQQRDAQDGRMSVAAYRLTGGIRGAVEATAEDVYHGLDPAERSAARHLLLAMVRIGPGQQTARRRISPEQLASLPPDPDTTHRVVTAFADARLLTLDADGAQLAHEALLSAWPRLRTWIDTDHALLRDRQRLTEAAEAWESCGRDPAVLYRGTQLATAAETLAATHTGRATPEARFIAAARTAASRHARRRRNTRAGLILLTVLVLLASVTAWQQARGRVQRDAEAASRQLASRAEGLRYTRPVEAMRMSVAAWHIQHTPEAEAALLASAAQAEQDAFRPPVGDGADEYHGAHLSGNGRVVLTRDDRHVHAWDVVRHERVARIRHRGRQVQDLSADGRRIVLGGGNRSRVYDVRSARPVGPAFRTPSEPASFSPTGRHVVVQDLSSIGVRRTESGRVTRRVPLTRYADVPEVAISRDDRILAFCRAAKPGGRHVLEVRGTAGGPAMPAPLGKLSRKDRRTVCGNEQLGHRIVLDPRGRFLVSLGDTARAWDLRTGRSWLASPVHASAAFSDDGEFLGVTTDEEVLLWRTSQPGRPVYRHSLNGGSATQLRIDTEDRAIRYWEDGTTVRTLALGNALTSDWRRERVVEAQYSPDGGQLALARRSGGRMRFELRPAAPGAAPRLLATADCGLSEPGDVDRADRSCDVLMSFSADGRRLAYGIRARHGYTSRRHPQTVHVWDVREGREHSRHVLARAGRADEDAVGFALGPDGATLLVLRDTARQLETVDLRAGGDAQTAPVAFNGRSPGNGHLVLRPDGAFAAGAGGLYRLPSGRRPTRPPLLSGSAHRVAFSADSTLLATGGHTGRVALWNGDGTQLLADLHGTFDVSGDGSGSPVTALALSPDSRTLAAGDSGGRVALYDVPSSRLLVAALPTAGDAVRALAFGPDGRTVLATGEHSSSYAYRLDHGHLVDRVCARTEGGFSAAEWEKHIPGVPYGRTCT
ncbi:WD40 repeat domain-containing protein [Streptomyces sp. NPDC054878]